ncbi:putative serine protease YyxA [Virgibacillus pantothenticus]|uniref:Serine protease n=1 Tax=Virgibacillus pantothenticus TaxID=1473 RepID=A0A0L0QRH4_VIRPA|nr:MULTISPECIES: trypsin-like peptidase domain-containing protein [Virgibacillus]API92187.1 serine protease [Virgibacillus sp. 6R]KNE21204.1 serine protease [Virgibacillus pantothenticus]MBS7427216.1 trypsin-like peptidase domain-containing protein [Virgibacillus sp. 19R1-5]MBU8567427.1 trypsin-like peptidase domain-containing protein [Virgibacillus pantothenticus]MBU8601210.1 trypsin-like peptidase domain-containing protein [Virgibacillus pantothenticus]
MGYYDQHYPPNPKKKKRSWLVPLLLGAILGVLLVTVALPALVDTGLLSNSQQQQDNQRGIDSSDGGSRGPTEVVNVDVSTQITEVINQVAPAVVGVINIQNQMDFWQQQEEYNQAGEGSGVIYKKADGTAFVVTNHHVVEGADTIEVVLADDTHVEAELVGSDLFSDLAVLKMDGSQVDQAIEIGSSANVKTGEPAIAIGNPLGLMFSGSVTQGVISGTERTIPQDFNQDGRADWQAEVIQTDAAINPGNSGGALINIRGQLIGINSMKINQTAVEGLGFAIPIDSALPIMEELETEGKVTRPYLGVEIYSLDEVPQTEWDNTLGLPENIKGGVYVWSVEPLSPADQAGLKRLDVITELDGKQVMNMIDLRKILYQEKEVGDDISVTYYRGGKKQKTTIQLGTQE